MSVETLCSDRCEFTFLTACLHNGTHAMFALIRRSERASSVRAESRDVHLDLKCLCVVRVRMVSIAATRATARQAPCPLLLFVLILAASHNFVSGVRFM